MRAARQPAEHVFGADDRQREGSRRAVQRRADQHAARLAPARASAARNAIAVGDVLDDLERQHGVEPLAFGGEPALGGRRRGSRWRARSPRHGRGRRAIASRAGVDAGHARSRAAPSARATSPPPQPISAEAQPVERRSERGSRPKCASNSRADEVEADRVELVQRPKAAAGSHQLGACAAKRSISCRIDGAGACSCRASRSPPCVARAPPRDPGVCGDVNAAGNSRAGCESECRASCAVAVAGRIAPLREKTWRASFRNSAAPRSPTSSASAMSPAASSARSMPATRSRSSSRPWPAPPTSWSTGRSEISPLHDAREYDVVVASGEQVTGGPAGAGAAGARRQRALLARLADPDPHRRRPRQGAHRGDRDRRDRAPLGRGAGRRSSPGFQGLAPRRPHHDPGPRRLGYLGGGAGGGAQGRSLRHLHRCRRRLHDRSAHRCEGAQAR